MAAYENVDYFSFEFDRVRYRPNNFFFEPILWVSNPVMERDILIPFVLKKPILTNSIPIVFFDLNLRMNHLKEAISDFQCINEDL